MAADFTPMEFNLFFPELKNDMNKKKFKKIYLHNCNVYCHHLCIRIKTTLETITIDVTVAASADGAQHKCDCVSFL